MKTQRLHLPWAILAGCFLTVLASGSALAQVSTWTVPIEITGVGQATPIALEFGTKANATDDFDANVDMVLPPPPPPPSTTIYAAFQIPPPFPYLAKDFRDPATTPNEWVLYFTNASSGVYTMSWNTTNFPEPFDPGILTICSSQIGVIDMLAQSSVNITGPTIEPVTIHYEATAPTITVVHSRINVISFNKQTFDPAAEMVFAALENLLVAQDDQGAFYIPPFFVNTIGNIDVAKGYQIFITGAANDLLRNAGCPLVPSELSHTFSNTQIFMVGYPYQKPHAVEEVFAAIASAVVVVQDDEGNFWIPRFFVNTLGNMLPGKGYQIFVDQPNTAFTYPDLAGGAAGKATPTQKPVEPKHFEFYRTGLAYGIVITGSAAELKAGDEIGVFAGERCVGAAVFTGKYPFVIAAWEGHKQHDLPGFEAGEAIRFRLWKAAQGAEFPIQGRFAAAAAAVFRGGPISAVSLEEPGAMAAAPDAFALEQNYPNPFNPETVIVYRLPVATKVSLKVYNVRGELVRRLVNGQQEPGSYRVVWDARDERGRSLASGTYLYELQAGEYKATKRLVLLR
jgi:hypothetical protein